MGDQVRVCSWIRASDADIKSGLLGFIGVEFGPLLLDGIVLRKTTGGRFALSFPSRTDKAGRRHPYIRPIDDDARIAIEREILGQLGQRQDAHAAAEADDA